MGAHRKISAARLPAGAKVSWGRSGNAVARQMLPMRSIMRVAAFPSVAWFESLAEARSSQAVAVPPPPGPADLTLVIRVVYPEGYDRLIALEFDGRRRVTVTAPADVADVTGPHPVVLEGPHDVWQEMIEAIQAHGRADPAHTLAYLTNGVERLRVLPLDDEDAPGDLERFLAQRESLQAFFDEAAAMDTRFAG